MPSIHIPEATFAAYVDACGGYADAKERIKAVVAGEAEAVEVGGG